MKLVKFKDGTYGVRKFWLCGWHFVDLKSDDLTWQPSDGSYYFQRCKGTREEAEAKLHSLKITHEVIK